MEPIYIPRLTHLPQQMDVIEFKEAIPELDTLTPVQGRLQVVHRGNYLEVSATVETIVTLACDRCLQHYNYRIAITPQELIWLQDEAPLDELLFDQDLEPDDLLETLSPMAHFDPTRWIYEQVCLELPPRKLCDPTCKGIEIAADAESQTPLDSRWAALASLKQQIDLN
jgi:uncharacterized protein